MDHPLPTISYIADIGNIVVLMARRKLPRQADASVEKQLYKMICHVFHSTDVSFGGLDSVICLRMHPETQEMFMENKPWNLTQLAFKNNHLYQNFLIDSLDQLLP